MNTTQHTPKPSISIALLLALSLSLIGGVIVFIMTSNLGNALVATGIGFAIGFAIYLVNAAERRRE